MIGRLPELRAVVERLEAFAAAVERSAAAARLPREGVVRDARDGRLYVVLGELAGHARALREAARKVLR